MIPLELFLLAIGSFGLGGLLLSLYLAGAPRRKRMNEVASLVGLRAGLVGGLKGGYRGYAIQVDGQVILVTLTADPRELSLRLVAHQISDLAMPGTALNLIPTQSGHPELDARYAIRCQPEDLAREAFAQHRALAERLAASPFDIIELDGQRGRVATLLNPEHRGVEREEFRQLIDLSADLADLLNQHR
ncbi:MAG: hypothetical protein GYB68_04545 [Chloroflexi bacterium]|nr:hypothetical protein [Chloroflexota bacterium]